MTEIYRSRDSESLAIETADGEFIELGRNSLGSWDKLGMIEVVPNSWDRLTSMREVTEEIWHRLEDQPALADPAVREGLAAMRRGEVTEA